MHFTSYFVVLEVPQLNFNLPIQNKILLDIALSFLCQFHYNIQAMMTSYKMFSDINTYSLHVVKLVLLMQVPSHDV